MKVKCGNLLVLFFVAFLGKITITIVSINSVKVARQNRSVEDLKAIGFEYAKNYIKSFTNHKNTKISLVSFDKPNAQNNFMGKFLFVEHKEDVIIENLQKVTPNPENGLVFFRVCVPENTDAKSFLDIFCPFSACTKYDQFLDSKLSCLSDLKPEVRSSIEEINKFAKN